jgi:hypothetical protein
VIEIYHSKVAWRNVSDNLATEKKEKEQFLKQLGVIVNTAVSNSLKTNKKQEDNTND